MRYSDNVYICGTVLKSQPQHQTTYKQPMSGQLTDIYIYLNGD